MRKLAVVLALLGSPVGAEPLTGNRVIKICENFESATDGTVNNGICLAYVWGAWHGIKHGAFHAAMFLTGKFDEGAEVERIANGLLQVCMPAGVTAGQTVQIVVNYLNETPEIRHHPVTWTIPDALGTAFPCN